MERQTFLSTPPKAPGYWMETTRIVAAYAGSAQSMVYDCHAVPLHDD
jgi:hypothetical protein